MKAGVVVDDWKLPIFERNFDAEGYTYEVLKGPSFATTSLIVEYESLADVHRIVEAANEECRRWMQKDQKRH